LTPKKINFKGIWHQRKLTPKILTPKNNWLQKLGAKSANRFLESEKKNNIRGGAIYLVFFRYSRKNFRAAGQNPIEIIKGLRQYDPLEKKNKTISWKVFKTTTKKILCLKFSRKTKFNKMRYCISDGTPIIKKIFFKFQRRQ